MISICLKKSLKRSSASQAARVIAIADIGITAAVNLKKVLVPSWDKGFFMRPIEWRGLGLRE